MEEQEKEFSEAFAEFATGERKEEEPAVEFEKDGEPVEDVAEEPSADEQTDEGEEAPVEEVDEAEGEAADEDVDWAERARQLEQEIEQWKHKFYSDAGRVGALQRKINELEAALQSRSLEQPQAKAAADDNGDELPPELAEFKEDYPDIYQAMQKLMDAEMQRRIAAVEQEVQQSLAPVQQVITQQTVAAEIAALEAQHPDWQEVAVSPEFSEWLSSQPQSVQQMAASDYASDVSFVLSAFKTQTRAQQPQERPAASGIAEKRKRQLESATSVPSRGSSSSTPLADDDYDAAFAYYASKKANSN